MNGKNTTRLRVAPITQLFDYIKNRDSQNALKHIDSMTDKRLLSVTDNKNMTVMMYACSYLLEDVAIKILSSGSSNLSQVSSIGKTAFIYACSNFLTRVASLIIDNGNNFKPAQADEDLCTALMWCCVNSMSDIAIKLVLTDKNLNYGQQDRDGDTALMIACLRSLNEVTMTMIRSGRSHPEIVNDENVSPLMVAIHNGMIETSIALIKTGMSVPETVSDHKQTALIITCLEKLGRISEDSKDFDSVILELLNRDCNIEYIDGYGQAAFDYYIHNYFDEDNIATARFGNTEILLLFVHYYYHSNQTSDVFIRNMNIICNTPLLRAIVRHGIPGIQIDEFCKTPTPINTEGVSFVPLAEANYDETDDKNDKDTKSKKRKNESIVDADEIHLTTAIPEDDDYYTNEYGERVQVPVMSEGDGVLIPKRMGGKRKFSKKHKGKGKGKKNKNKSKKINRKKRFNKKNKTRKQI
jgi:ankyrin repeat protein